MPVQFNVQNARTGAPATQSLNASRVATILKAGSRNEALRMGVFDKIKDFFRGGVKAEAIRQLYDEVTIPQTHKAQPIDMLHRFERLRALASDEHQSQFSAAVQTGTDAQQGQWTFSLSVGDTPIYGSEILEDGPTSSTSEFNQAVQMYQGIHEGIERFRLGEGEVAATQAIRKLMGDENNSATPAEMFAFVRDLQPINNPYLQKLEAEKQDRVSLLSLCLPGQTEGAEQLVRFDKARTLLTPELWTKVAQEAVTTQQRIPARTLEEYALSNTQEFVEQDPPGQQQFIIENFDNPLFSRQNFKHIEPGNDEKTFKAIFQREGEEPQVLELSDRSCNHGEYRGSFVQNILQNHDYVNLREVLSVGLMGPRDPIVVSTSTPLLIDSIVNRLGLVSYTDLQDFLQNLKQHGPRNLAQQTFDALRNTQFAQTNLLVLSMGDSAPAALEPAELIAPGSLA